MIIVSNKSLNKVTMQLIQIKHRKISLFTTFHIIARMCCLCRNGLLRPRENHYFSFLIFAFLLSQYLLIISACLCFLPFDHPSVFIYFPQEPWFLVIFPFPLSLGLHILLLSCIRGSCQRLSWSIYIVYTFKILF